MKKLKILLSIGILLLLLFANNSAKTQCMINPPAIDIDITQGEPFDFTITITSVNPNQVSYSISIYQQETEAPWVNSIVPSTILNMNEWEQEDVVFSGVAPTDWGLGEDAFLIEVYDTDNYYNSRVVSYEILPGLGFEDNVFLNGPDDFSELDQLLFTAHFSDVSPPNYITEWNLVIDLFSSEGKYTYIDLTNEGSPEMTSSSWSFIANELPQYLSFSRNTNGQVYGIATVTATEDDTWELKYSIAIGINKEPDIPSLYPYVKDDNSVDMTFNYTGGTTNYIYYDTDSGEPYNGTGLNQGDSPINLGNSTFINLEGLQDCAKYYFVAQASNNFGLSAYSEEKCFCIFDAPNSLPINYFFSDLHPSNSFVFENNQYFTGDLIVESGTTISMTGGFMYFEENSKIIIEPGGKLILDGTTCTAPCGQTWAGIEVWGNPDEHQYTINDVCYQGILELKGEATIENAVIGVLLGAKNENGSFNNEKNGGIINADYIDDQEQVAYFLNNYKSIYFRDYHNSDPFTPEENEMANLSLIENCTFEVNQGYLMGDWTSSHIYMSKVTGIKIRGNTFNYGIGGSPSGHGINAYEAGFRVEAICNSIVAPCPDDYLDKNSFANFAKGVNLIYAGSYTATVKNSEFHNNSSGIALNNVNNASLLFNEFYLGEAGESDGDLCGGKTAAYGIDLLACAGFAVEENTFEKADGAPLGNYIGIRVTACPSESDVIYKNEFNGVSVGNQAEDINQSIPFYAQTGVTYYCNKNDENTYDFYVSDNSTVGGYMGWYDNPSGNTLSPNAMVQFQNEYIEPIIYFYNLNEPDEVLSNYSTGVYIEPVSDENTCPSHYGGGGEDPKRTVLTPGQKLEAEQSYASNLNDYNSVKVLFDNLKDGGNTEATLIDVETAWPNDMWEIRSKLLGDSPHLSIDVLKAAADKTDVLPESVLFEILSANPDELKKDELIKYLEDKQNPLPAYMVDILRQMANGSSYKTVLLSEMASYHAKKVGAAQDIIRSILNEDETDMVELRNWLDNIGGLETDKQIIATYLTEGNYVAAQSLLDMLPALYGLDGDALIQYDDYKLFTELMMDIEQDSRTVFDLSELELASLTGLAETGYGSAKTSAQGILEFAYGHDYCNCPDLPDGIGMKSSTTIDLDKLAQAKGLDITVNPNPANTWAAFAYTLPLTKSEGVIEISDNSGRVLQHIKVSQQQGQYVLDTRNYKSGIYYYTITCSDLQRTGKLIVK